MEDKLPPLPKTITDEIRSILTRCRSGELNHGQSSFHCGTAHCVAGWKVVLDAADQTGLPELLTAEFILPSEGSFPLAAPENSGLEKEFRIWQSAQTVKFASFDWNYARDKWLLTEVEATALFEGEATFDQQFSLLEKLESGVRFEHWIDDDDDDGEGWLDDDDYDDFAL